MLRQMTRDVMERVECRHTDAISNRGGCRLLGWSAENDALPNATPAYKVTLGSATKHSLGRSPVPIAASQSIPAPDPRSQAATATLVPHGCGSSIEPAVPGHSLHPATLDAFHPLPMPRCRDARGILPNLVSYRLVPSPDRVQSRQSRFVSCLPCFPKPPITSPPPLP